jgi:hypothetical protein
MRDHIKYKHLGEKRKKRFKCKQCDKRFEGRYPLKVHMACVHQGESVMLVIISAR